MNATRSALAVLALALGTAVFASSEASARDPDKEMPVRPEVVSLDPAPPNYPAYDARYEVTPVGSSGSADDTRVEVVQAGASALGGAGVACGVMWLYRRRGRLAT
jgi:hypothetical protein